MRAFRLIAPVALIAAPLVAGEPSPFAGIPGIRFDHYDIAGRTPAQIYASMRARAPHSGEDGLGVAQTIWQMDVHWREMHRGSSCKVTDPTTDLSIRVLLPRLTTISEATPRGLAFWRATLWGLEVHEGGHAHIAWDHRDDFNEAAQTASCKSIARVAREAQVGIAELQDDYDSETHHGQTQTPPIRL